MKRAEVEKIHDEFLEKFDKAVNMFMSGEELEQLAAKICHSHRTLQQNKMRLIVEMLKIWAKMYARGEYDLRNEATCEVAWEIIQAVPAEKLWLPTV